MKAVIQLTKKDLADLVEKGQIKKYDEAEGFGFDINIVDE